MKDLRENLILILFIIGFIILVIGTSCSASITTTSEDYIPSDNNFIIESDNFIYTELTDKAEIENQIQLCISRKQIAHDMANNARTLYGEDNIIVTSASAEWNRVNDIQIRYEDDLYSLIKEEEAVWSERIAQYPHATTIWRFLNEELGYNDYVCAGILGNIMNEVGGNSLSISYWLYNPSGYYYGICQWNKGAYGSVHGTELDAQLTFLANTIEYEMNTYGSNYTKGFNYDSFVSLTNERSVALAFAKCYERCSSSSYTARQNNAEKAYEYFVG